MGRSRVPKTAIGRCRMSYPLHPILSPHSPSPHSHSRHTTSRYSPDGRLPNRSANPQRAKTTRILARSGGKAVRVLTEHLVWLIMCKVAVDFALLPSPRQARMGYPATPAIPLCREVFSIAETVVFPRKPPSTIRLGTQSVSRHPKPTVFLLLRESCNARQYCQHPKRHIPLIQPDR